MSELLKEALRKLYQWHYQFRDENDFTLSLFTSFQRANAEEFKKLAKAFPTEAQAYRLWNEAKDPIEFFKSHGIGKRS